MRTTMNVTAYVAAGMASASAIACSEPAAVVETRPEAAGTNCPQGGTAVVIGADADGSGTLDAEEVHETRYVCSGADGPLPTDIRGDVVVESLGQLARYVELRTLTGSLTASLSGSIAMPALASVGGYVICEASGGTVELPALSTVAAFLRVGQSPAAAFTIPELVSAGELRISGVTALRAPKLEATGQILVQAESLELPVLRSATYLYLDPAIASLQAPMLSELDSLWVVDAAAISTVSLPALARTNQMRLANLASLTSISMPALTTISFGLEVSNNAALTSLAMPQLTSLQTLTVTQNPLLPTCQATAIATRTGATSTVTGNGTGSCP